MSKKLLQMGATVLIVATYATNSFGDCQTTDICFPLLEGACHALKFDGIDTAKDCPFTDGTTATCKGRCQMEGQSNIADIIITFKKS